MKKIILLTGFFILVINMLVLSQVTLEWSATYHPGGDDETARSIAVDGSGNAYVTGHSFVGVYKGSTVKYNSSGSQLWVATNSFKPSTIALNYAGNAYVDGSSNFYNDRLYTTKYNSSGVQQWGFEGYYYNNGVNVGAISVDGSGNVYVTCSGSDYIAIKYNSSGVQQWLQNYNGPGDGADDVYSSIIDSSGNVYVTGASWGGTSTGYDYATIKYNSSGDSLWVQRYNGPGNGSDRASKITLDGLSNVYVTGVSLGNGSMSDYATIKYNSSGVQQWVQRYDGPGNDIDFAQSIAVDASGNAYVTGASTGIGTGLDYCTIKYNSSGVQQWIQRYGTANGDETPSSIITDEYNNVYVTGNGGTIKYNSAGVQQWIIAQNGVSIVLYGSNKVFVIGPGFTTKKYSQQIGIKKISTEIPSSFSLSQNYPNPFNPKTIINFQIPKSNFVTLKIYDILGSEVATLVNEQLKSGTYQVDWDATNYSSGVYLYKLTSREFIETKKMILMK